MMSLHTFVMKIIRPTIFSDCFSCVSSVGVMPNVTLLVKPMLETVSAFFWPRGWQHNWC